MLEGQRALLYVAVLAALVLLVRRSTVPLVLAATLVAIFLASGYGLLTRLFPERLGVFDPVAAYRLEEPLTYWNALGIFAAMGALLALGFAAAGAEPRRQSARRGDAALSLRDDLLHVQPRSLGRGSDRVSRSPSPSTRAGSSSCSQRSSSAPASGACSAPLVARRTR